MSADSVMNLYQVRHDFGTFTCDVCRETSRRTGRGQRRHRGFCAEVWARSLSYSPADRQAYIERRLAERVAT